MKDKHIDNAKPANSKPEDCCCCNNKKNESGVHQHQNSEAVQSNEVAKVANSKPEECCCCNEKNESGIHQHQSNEVAEVACPHCNNKKSDSGIHQHQSNEVACCCNEKNESGVHKHQSNEIACACCDLTPKYTKVGEAKSKRLDNETISSIVRLSVSIAFLIAGFFDWHTISGGSGALLALYYFNPAWIAVILCGIPVFMSAVRSLKNKKLTASVLISIAMLASIALEIASFFVSLGDAHSHSYVFAAGEIAALMELGELLEDLTVKKCRSGIQRLVGLIPTEANVITADGTVRLDLSKVNIGDHVLIKAGEMVPVDGVVVSGSASIDQSSLTGEFVPVDVTANDSVFGGTMSKSGVVEVEVSKLQKDMTIAKMAELTIEAEGKKAPISRLADKWASIIVPMVFATSIIVGLICGLGTDIGAIPSIIRAITVLVVFCPCSLVLATPTAIAAGLGNSAKHGVLIKSGESLEELSRVDTVCFDKTGTITEGKIELSDVVAVGIDREELLRLSASVEQYSSHPLAVAVLQSAENHKLYNAESHKLYSAENVKTINGVGISASCNGQEVAVLSLKNALGNGVDLTALQGEIDGALAVGKTVAIVLLDGIAKGALAFQDTIRENAKAVMSEMKDCGYHTIMLTGDNGRSANFIASQCNIAEVKYDLLPENKLTAIEDLQSEKHKVVMVGDGINDAPSLKIADCSFAMGAMGSDIAIDSADMAILNSDIQKVADTMRLSKRVMRTIKRNIAIAMSISAVGVILSALGFLTPVTGALVHNCTSVLVVASSALVLYSRKRKNKDNIVKID